MFDACIVGGGIAGLFTAFFLAEKQKKVVIIEKRAPGECTSTRCDGILSVQTKKDPFSVSLTLESKRIYSSIQKKHHIGYMECGGLLLFVNEEEREEASKILDLSFVESIGRKRLLSLFPFLSQKLNGAFFCAEDARVDTLKLYAFLYNEARKKATFFTNTKIAEVKRKKPFLIYTEDGKRFFTKNIIITAGIEMEEAFLPFGKSIKIEKVEGLLLVTEKAPFILPHILLSASYLLSKKREEKEYSINFSAEQTEEGNILLGSLRATGPFSKEEAAIKIADCAKNFLPILSALSIIRIFHGSRPYLKDSAPLFGQVDEALYTIGGLGADGVSFAPAISRMLSEKIS